MHDNSSTDSSPIGGSPIDRPPIDNASTGKLPEENTLTENKRLYWRANIRLMLILLAIWIFVSFILGIVFVEQLNTIRLGGYKLGFWFAQQGAMYTFVVLVFVYARSMAKLDKKFGVEE